MKKQNDSIAIIGMSCAFPGAKDIKAFWRNLQNGVDSITHFMQPDENSESLKRNKKIYARGILEDIEYFDRDFFGITKQDAATMDPQHRLFLEKCVEAVDDAGCDLERYQGIVGIFAGAAESSYLINNLLKNTTFLKNHMPYRTKTLTSPGFLSTRTSYLLNLTGPSININTACSSGLVAVIQACKALQDNECDMALSGTIAIQCPQHKIVTYQPGSILSLDGVCRPFDQKASGTVSANGVGVVVLKRLSDAISDHDNIIAVISGFAINNDGNAKAGFTAPSVTQQANCIKTALQAANHQPNDISYIETHGTGTPLGDLIEITALKNVFSEQDCQYKSCALGAVKANIGHTDMAAGMAGLIKAALSLKHQQLVPTPHYEVPNSKLNLNQSVFYVNTQLTDWKLLAGQQKRIACVNSLGIGGTNAHIVLEESHLEETNRSNKPWYPIVLSAHTQESLKQYINHLIADLGSCEDMLANIAYTFALGRSARKFRKSYTVNSIENLKKQLLNDIKNPITSSQKVTMVFLLGGQYDALPSSWFEIANDVNSIFKLYVNDCIQHVPGKLKQAWQKIPPLAIFIFEYTLMKVLHGFGIKLTNFIVLDEVGKQLASVLTEEITLNSAIEEISNRYRSSQETYKSSFSYTSFDIIQANQCGEIGSTISTYDNFSKEGPLILISLVDKESWCDQLQGSFSKEKFTSIIYPDFYQTSFDENNFYHYLSKLLTECWQYGANINWINYFENENLRKISLPTTVFQKEKAWIEPSKQKNERLNLEQRCNFATPYWQIINLKLQLDLTTKKTWVIFANNDLLSQNLICFLENHQQNILVVYKHNAGANLHKGHRAIFLDLLNQSGCKAAKSDLLENTNIIDHVIYLWSTENMNFKKIEMIKNMITWVLPINQKNKINLHILTKRTVCLTPQDRINIKNTFLQGFCRVISQEYPIITTLLDIDDNVTDQNAIVKNIVNHCINQRGSFIAFRSNMAFAQQFKPIQLHSKKIDIKHNCVILITGGFGKIGLEIARYFAYHYQANILLLAHHSNLSSDEAYLSSLEACNKKINLEVEKILTEINDHAASLTLAFGDVGNYVNLAKITARYLEKYFAFDYVFHLAAALKNNGKHVISEMNQEKIMRQWHPKVTGLQNLNRLSKWYPINVIVVFSSIASFIGGASMATYAGVSTALDAYYELTQLKSTTNWLCINWDAWRFNQSNQSGLDADLAISLLIKLLEKNRLKKNHIIVSHPDVTERLKGANFSKKTIELQVTSENLLNLENKKDILRNIFKENLGNETIEDHGDFYDYGGDSLLGIDILDKIEKIFSISLDSSFIIQNRTIDQICSALENVQSNKKTTIQAMNEVGYTPLFLLNPVSGMSVCYVDLAKSLNKKFTCYAIQDHEIKEKNSFSSLDEMAACYLAQIKLIQPAGDYILVGYSFGGAVAHAMTKQLENQGTLVRLFIIDGWAAASDELRNYKRFEMTMKKHAIKIQRSITNTVKTKELIQQLWQRMQLLLHYNPPIIKNDIYLLKAKKILAEYQAIDDPYNHWQHYTQGKINLCYLSYDHESILCPEASKVISTFIQKNIINVTHLTS